MSTDVKAEFGELSESFTEAEWNEAEALAELGHALIPGLTEDGEVRFVLAGIKTKLANPSATGGEEINAGLAALGEPPLERKAPQKKVRKRGVRGV